MSDLIERLQELLQVAELERYFNALALGGYWEDIKETITALREQEARVAELEITRDSLMEGCNRMQAKIDITQGKYNDLWEMGLSHAKAARAEIEQRDKLIRDMWPLMALKTRWLEKHPEYRELIDEVTNADK